MSPRRVIDCTRNSPRLYAWRACREAMGKDHARAPESYAAHAAALTLHYIVTRSGPAPRIVVLR